MQKLMVLYSAKDVQKALLKQEYRELPEVEQMEKAIIEEQHLKGNGSQFPLDKELDQLLQKVVKRHTGAESYDGAGSGLGMRDMDWEFDDDVNLSKCQEELEKMGFQVSIFEFDWDDDDGVIPR